MREKLGQVEVPPRPEIWEALQTQLLPPPVRRRGTTWMWLGAMAVSTAAAITLLWLFWPGPASSPTSNQLAPLQAEAPVDTASPSQALPQAERPAANQRAELSPHVETAPLAASPLSAPVSLPNRSPAASSPALLAVKPLPLPHPAWVDPLRSLAGPLFAPLSDIPAPEINAMLPLAAGEEKTLASLAQQAIPNAPLPPPDFPDQASRMRGWSYRLQAGSSFQGGNGNVPMALSALGGSGLQADYVNVSGGQTRFGNLPAENVQTVNLPQTQVNMSFRLAYRLNRRWGLESGLGLSLFEMGRAQSTWFAPNSSTDFESLSGPVDFSQLEVQTSNQATFQPVQLELPLYLNRYLPGPGRGQLLLSAGLSLNTNLHAQPAEDQQALLATQSTYDRSLNTAGSSGFVSPTNESNAQVPYAGGALLGLRRFHSHAALRLLYQLPLSGRHAFFVGPEFRYQLMPMYLGPAATVIEPYHLGFQLGLRL
jgi:hypothetical protein